MVSYNQKDVRIQVGGADLFCNSADIKYDASVSPEYRSSNRYSYEFRASAPPKGSFNINYFLTGSDALYDLVYAETTPISLSFNGLSVPSGYLTSYSFSAQPHSPTEISASFDFYEKVGGTFSADDGFSLDPSDFSPILVSDMSLDNGVIVGPSKIKNIDYNYKSTINPSYVVEENFDSAGVNINGVTSSEKRVDVSFGLYDYNFELPVTGLHESFNFNFKDKNSNSVQTYSVNGQLVSKAMGAKAGERVSVNYSLSQANLGHAFHSLRSSLPASGPAGATLTISVNGLTDINHIEQVHVGEFPCTINRSSFTYLALDDGIGVFTATVPTYILAGYKGAINLYGVGNQIIGAAHNGQSYFTATNGVTSF